MKLLTGLSTIADKFDLMLIDLWGVVHDGTHLYPDVLNVLTHLRGVDKKIIFISNAPRRSTKVVGVLEELGVKAGTYDFVVSSGEVGFQWLKEGNAPWGNTYFYIGPDKDLDVLDGLDYTRANDITKADFLVNVGFGTEYQSSADFASLLQHGQQLKLPMLCLNPDLEVVKQTGERFPCAGVLAHEYRDMGGLVIWFGKPYPEVYDYCIKKIGMVNTSRVLAIGDSLETDIAGGLNYGLSTLLITGGILREHSAAAIQEKTSKLNVLPHYHMPQLTW